VAEYVTGNRDKGRAIVCVCLWVDIRVYCGVYCIICKPHISRRLTYHSKALHPVNLKGQFHSAPHHIIYRCVFRGYGPMPDVYKGAKYALYMYSSQVLQIYYKCSLYTFISYCVIVDRRIECQTAQQWIFKYRVLWES